VTLVAPQAIGTEVPTSSGRQSLAIFGGIPEQLRWTTEVAHMVRVDAALGIMRVFLSWAPTGLVEEHIKQKVVVPRIDLRQRLV
jgi:hypothetical protein